MNEFNNSSTLNNPFIKVISKFGELDNASAPSIVTEAHKNLVPVIKWRWKQNNGPLEFLIEKAISEFQGNLKWHSSKSEGGGWGLSIQDVITDFNTSSSNNFAVFRAEWSKRHHAKCVQAHDELKNLAEFVERHVTSEQNGDS